MSWRRLVANLALVLTLSLAGARAPAGAATIRVGPGQGIATPGAAARIVRDGDRVEIEAGTYTGDVAVWRANGLVIRGVGGRARLEAAGAHAEGKAIWVIKGADTTVEDIEFRGARVPDRNGAGIRQEGPGLVVRRCVFHDNENGILAGANPASDILVEASEFVANGHGDGYSHNLYVGAVRRLTVRGSLLRDARGGHGIKSRAAETVIVYNRIVDGPTGTTSYEIDLPNGGVAYVIGNVIRQGPRGENATLLSYGAEGLGPGPHTLFVINNTFVNDRARGGRFLFVARGTPEVVIRNNIFAGAGTLLTGPGDPGPNLHSPDPGFADPQGGDYRLRPGSPAIDAGVPPGRGRGIDLTPVHEPAEPAGERPRARRGPLDLGAYEFGG